ncbi:MAG: hypothetical protein WC047_08535, partial [Kiritimatiellales bacterium]
MGINQRGLFDWTGKRFLLLMVCFSSRVFAGGGENLLLVVNPGDEQQVRIAAEYQRTRHLADRQIVFIEPRKDNSGFYMGSEDARAYSVTNHYLLPVYNHMADHGLTNQIDYIATLGMPFRCITSNGVASFTHLLEYTDILALGLDTSVYYGTNSFVTPITINDFPEVLNPRYKIDNSELPYFDSSLTYMATALGYTGIFGNSPGDIISNFQRTASTDGTRPQGTVYFEENDDIRSDTREPDWSGNQLCLSSYHIDYIQESDVSGGTPMNRIDVRGAVIGAAYYTVPNGSFYLPGSWADSLTSYGCDFTTRLQTKATELIGAGIGGTCGTVTEPYANPEKFPDGYNYCF